MAEQNTSAPPANDVVLYERRGRVGLITLNRPEARNAVNGDVAKAMEAAIDRLEADDEVWVGVLSATTVGDRPVFSAGADLKERAVGLTDSTDLVQAIERLATIDAPVIAAVDGAVRAGGMGLVAACDLVVASPQASFACPEVRVGVAPAIISVPLIQRCGWTNLAEAMLTGEPFDAARAAHIGLVNVVADDVDQRVDQLCAAILGAAPGAVAATKRLLRGQPGTLAEMQALSDELFAGEEAAEGMRAFTEKRRPQWAGGQDDSSR